MHPSRQAVKESWGTLHGRLSGWSYPPGAGLETGGTATAGTAGRTCDKAKVRRLKFEVLRQRHTASQANDRRRGRLRYIRRERRAVKESWGTLHGRLSGWSYPPGAGLETGGTATAGTAGLRL